MSESKIYRPNVAAIILSHNYPQEKEIFLAQRSDLRGVWQFPQGGIDEGETPEVALFRELEEEIGTNDIEVIASLDEWISYDFPKKIAKKMQPYCGQRQKYFLVKLSKDAKINLDTEHPEFIEYKFVALEKLFEMTPNFKNDVYKKAVKEFVKKGHL